jgi:hypothetical protein
MPTFATATAAKKVPAIPTALLRLCLLFLLLLVVVPLLHLPPVHAPSMYAFLLEVQYAFPSVHDTGTLEKVKQNLRSVVVKFCD